MPTEISERINAGVERVQSDIFAGGGVRVWKNDGVDVPLPSPDNDVIIVFTHFLQHFFCGGVGLRQICDWCRLLWTYRDSIDRGLLERRLKEMGIVSEWKAFGAFAVEWLGLPFTVYRLLLLEDDVNLLETCGTSEQARANDNENDNEDLNLKPETVLAAEGASDLPCGDGGRELRAQQGQLVPLEIPEAGGEEHHLLPQAGRVWTAVLDIPGGRPEVLCYVCRPEDEGGDGV